MILPVRVGAQTANVTIWPVLDCPYGASPTAPLIQASDHNFYGVTSGGGTQYSYGVVFQMSATGQLNVLHLFTGVDGANPVGSLVQARDGKLYGTTQSGGASNNGTVFVISTSGVFKTLHSFKGSDGAAPLSGLIQLSDGYFYGTTSAGGVNNLGTVFKLSSTGTVKTLRSLSVTDGTVPSAGLVQASDGYLYGTTAAGGAKGDGTIYRISTGGSFAVLHTFAGTDGADSTAPLIQATDGNLYGTAQNGGSGGFGTAFQMTPSGQFTLLHQFQGADGQTPVGGLLEASDGNLYGTTATGSGTVSYGTCFRLTLAGQLTTIYKLVNTTAYQPRATLIQGTDGMLYGTAAAGGAFGDGSIFRITTAGQATVLYSFVQSTGFGLYSGLYQASDGNLYTMTFYGGPYPNTFYAYGVICRITTDGQTTPVHPFDGGEGYYPYGALVQAADGNLYGATGGGGDHGIGTLFRTTLDGHLTILHSFDFTDGNFPVGPFVVGKDGALYGATLYNGPGSGASTSHGTIFRITTGGSFQTVYGFNQQAQGIEPRGALILAKDGNFYGTTFGGGTNNMGVVFRMTPAGQLTALASFDQSTGYTNPDAAVGGSGVVQASDGNFYGTNTEGGKGNGTIYRVTPSGQITAVYMFSGDDGAQPYAGLLPQPDGYLYGITFTDNVKHGGTIFRISTAGKLTTLYYFPSAGLGNSQTALIMGSDGCLYGDSINGYMFRVNGIYPAPVVSSISPATANAGAPALTLTVNGSNFQKFSYIQWNGTKLTTRYVSATQLTAGISASLLKNSETASVTVVTPAGGGLSNSSAFTIPVTTVAVQSASLTRSGSTITAKITLKNTGYKSAPDAVVTAATLGSTATTTQLPATAGTMKASASTTVTLTFPASAGSSGATSTLAVAGTFTGGSFSGSLSVTLP
jgi:uncharacterized repeat protein (TIGR03803 family)